MSPITWLALGAAILLEVVGTSLLQASQQFTRPVPTVAMAGCYLAAFYLLSVALREIPVGLAYAIWSGMGVVLIAMIGWVVFKQRLDAPAILGLAMIVGGVIVINVFSKTVSH
ncbi:SMR family transporter [Brevundimonas sp.]|uniref:DMT family transporter n=1 Tax=Brevundimonas sp. TaxID=1871086 RepID=UPI001D51D109|nr:SMR family transporter [Brevundimonas sp.]MBA4001407.1 QacE family quaternary ammonium compound efflux SMR transporter [Brevundimonas sp.]